jgi:prepilin-type N-terminal cleavage/methylation domain-containing protein
MKRRDPYIRAFTLIELSIVLVIIGLLVGGVLVGQDLIRAAEVRAQISQIEKYQAAANTFYGKYGYLPGDIRDPDATSFGFLSRGTGPCQGDGNGMLQGSGTSESCMGEAAGVGETAMFWVDLSTAHLIDGTFNTANPSTPLSTDVTGSAINLYFPQAKLGHGNYVYVWSSTTTVISSGTYLYFGTGTNFFGLAAVQLISSAGGTAGRLEGTAKNIPVAQASAIDKKMDDGLPITGRVQAIYLNNDPFWATGTVDPSMNGPNDILYDPAPTQSSGAPDSCFDNGGINGALEQYSLQQNGGAGANCALSFQFQ